MGLRRGAGRILLRYFLFENISLPVCLPAMMYEALFVFQYSVYIPDSRHSSEGRVLGRRKG